MLTSVGPEHFLITTGTPTKIAYGSDAGGLDPTPFLTLSGVEEISLDLQAGLDRVTVKGLDAGLSSGLIDVRVKTGSTDGNADTVTVQGDTNTDCSSDPTVTVNCSSNDTITVVGNTVTKSGAFNVIVEQAVRGHGDVLVIDGKLGNDTIDASALADDFAELKLFGSDGDDTLIGSDYNDRVDGGLGADRLTGGPGLDTFFDSSPVGEIDTLVETRNLDMSLFHDTFVAGTLADAPSDYIADAPGATATNPSDPDFRPVGDGDCYSTAIVEDIKGLFEAAEITGGAGNNTIVVSDADNTIFVGGVGVEPTIGGVVRKPLPWRGTATLNNGTGRSARSRPM